MLGNRERAGPHYHAVYGADALGGEFPLSQQVPDQLSYSLLESLYIMNFYVSVTRVSSVLSTHFHIVLYRQ